MPCGLPEVASDRDPRRRACLAFVRLVCRPLRCGDLGVISALMLAVTSWVCAAHDCRPTKGALDLLFESSHKSLARKSKGRNDMRSVARHAREFGAQI